MQEIEKSLFERALSASGLVDGAALGSLVGQLRDATATAGHEFDARLARLLIERGVLNEWQVEQLRIGRTKFTLGPYLIVDSIGKGGMGHVFKGQHELLGRTEAIKVLPQRKSTPHSIANFRHEIRAQAELDHPNLVRVSYAGQDGDTYYLVTEYVPGVDLRRLVRRMGALPADQAASIVVQAADALEYAHRRGLVHRDIKPGNLLIRPDGAVKVTDLGLAWRLEDSEGEAPGGGGKIVGTCDYIPPENIDAPDRIIPVSDIYSLGCTLYYAVTGKVPFPGGNAKEKLRRHQEDAPIAPTAFNPQLNAEFVRIIRQMMHKDHHQRTPSAAVAASELKEFVKEDTRVQLARLVESCEKAGPVGASVAGDLGDTVDAISDGALPYHSSSGAGMPDADAPSQASQATDPLSQQETHSGSERQRATAPPTWEEPTDGRQNSSSNIEHAKRIEREAWLVQLTIRLALAATVFILLATALKMLLG